MSERDRGEMNRQCGAKSAPETAIAAVDDKGVVLAIPLPLPGGAGPGTP